MATPSKQTTRDLLASGMSRQEIRQAIIDQRKGTSERAAERKAAEQVRKQEFSTIQQAQEFYGNVPQSVLRRTAGFKAIKEAQDKRIYEVSKSLEEIDTKIQQREQKKLSKQKANEWDSDDQDDFEEDIADLKAQRQGFQQGQQRLEKGEIIPTSKIQSYARDLGSAASREERARNIRGKQEREIARQLGFSGRQSYRQALPTLKKLQKGEATMEDVKDLPEEVRSQITFTEVPADTKQGITEQSQIELPSNIRRGNIQEIIKERGITSETAKLDKPQPLTPSFSFDTPEISTRETTKFGTITSKEYLGRVTPRLPTGNILTEDFRRIRDTSKTSKDVSQKMSSISEEISKIDTQIENVKEGNVDEVTNTWTGSKKDYEEYQKLSDTRQKKYSQLQIQEQRLESIGGKVTEEGYEFPKISTGLKDISYLDLEGSDITLGTKAVLETSAGVFGKVGEITGGVVGATKVFTGKEIFGLEEGEALVTIPEYETEIFEPQFGTKQVSGSGKEISGYKEITIPEQKIFTVTGDEPIKYAEFGKGAGEIVGYAAPFVAAGYAGGAVAAGAGAGALGIGLGAAVGETTLYAGLRGEEFADIVSEKGIIKGGTEFTLKYPLEVAGVGASFALPVLGAVGRGTKRIFKLGKTSKYLDEDLGKVYNVKALTEEITESSVITRPSVKMRQLIGEDEIIKSKSLSFKPKGKVTTTRIQPTGELAGDVFELRRTGLFKKEIIKGKVKIGKAGDVEEIFDLGDGLKKITTLEAGGKKGISRLIKEGDIISEVKLKGSGLSDEVLRLKEKVAEKQAQSSTGKGLQREQLILKRGDEMLKFSNIEDELPKFGEKITAKGKTKTVKGVDLESGRFEIIRTTTGVGEKTKVGEIGSELIKSSDEGSIFLSKRRVPSIEFGDDKSFDLLLRKKTKGGELLKESSKVIRKTRPRISREIKQFYDEELIFGRISPKAKQLKEAQKLKSIASKKTTTQYSKALKDLKKAQRQEKIINLRNSFKELGEEISSGTTKLIQKTSSELKDVAETVFIEPTESFIKKIRSIKRPDISLDLKTVTEQATRLSPLTKTGTSLILGSELAQVKKQQSVQRTKQESRTELSTKQIQQQEFKQIQKQQSQQRQINKQIFSSPTIFEIPDLRSPRIKAPRIQPPKTPKKPKPFIFLRPKKGKKKSKREKDVTELSEAELLAQGFTAAQTGLRRTVTEAQALQLARSPGRAVGIRAAYEIVPNRRSSPRRKKASKKKKRTKKTKNYEISGLEFTVPKGVMQ